MFCSKIVEGNLPKVVLDSQIKTALSGDWKRNSFVVCLICGLAACILLAVLLTAAWGCRTKLIR